MSFASLFALPLFLFFLAPVCFLFLPRSDGRLHDHLTLPNEGAHSFEAFIHNLFREIFRVNGLGLAPSRSRPRVVQLVVQHLLHGCLPLALECHRGLLVRHHGHARPL